MSSKKLLVALFCLLAAFTLRAQDYPFIRREANVLHYDTNSAPMEFLFQKWQRITATGQGNLSIVHIGGSHVQAGTLPHRIRTNILRAYPGAVGGRGLIFPYSAAAKCNNPADYKVHCLEKVILTRNVHKEPAYPMGLCGISVTAQDVPTRIQILNNDKQFDYAVSRIIVLGHSPHGVVPTVSYGNLNAPPSYIDTANHRFVFNLLANVDSFDIVLPCSQGQCFTLTGVYLSSRNHGITYSSIGVNGAAVPDYFKCSLTRDLKLVRPDLVIFGIGINDAHGSDFDSVVFKNNYLQLCDSIRSVNPHCAFIFITNNDSYRKTGRRSYTVNKNGLQVRDVCYRLAQLTGGAVWDQFEVMGGLKSMAQWQKAKLAQTDKVHFTHAGYQLVGDLFFEALNKELSKDWQPLGRKDNTTGPTATSQPATSQGQTLQSSPSQERPLPRGLRRKSRHTTHSPSPSSF